MCGRRCASFELFRGEVPEKRQRNKRTYGSVFLFFLISVLSLRRASGYQANEQESTGYSSQRSRRGAGSVRRIFLADSRSGQHSYPALCLAPAMAGEIVFYSSTREVLDMIRVLVRGLAVGILIILVLLPCVLTNQHRRPARCTQLPRTGLALTSCCMSVWWLSLLASCCN